MNAATLFEKILIAGRGEIACRIARTCHRLGIATATVHTAVDRGALHVATIGESIELEGNSAGDGYLNIESILAAARATGAQAVHPGIGFLAENAAFAEAVEAAGLAFIGPRPDTLTRFGDKISARHEAQAAGLPVLEGTAEGFAEAAEVESTIRDLGVPVLLKAAFGGGGRGMRVIRKLEGLTGQVASAMREAENAFGRPHLLIERMLEPARHVEVQIAGDGAGGVVHFFERECSLQRRFQKVIEESPAAHLPGELAGRLWSDACRLGVQARFRNLGTIEFLVSGHAYYFLECNPRLQVEHTVTEQVTGLDLVELQLRIAAAGALPLAQADIAPTGHAIEARLCAEDAADGFAPATGPVLLADFPAGQGRVEFPRTPLRAGFPVTPLRAGFPRTPLRVDAAIETGSEIGPRYDSLVAKLIAHGSTRGEALRRLKTALAETAILGVTTNLPFLAALLRHPAVVAGETDTGFIEREGASLAEIPEAAPEIVALAAHLHTAAHRAGEPDDPWLGQAGLTGWRLSDGQDEPPRKPAFLLRAGGKLHEVSVGGVAQAGEMAFRIDGAPVRLAVSATAEGSYRAAIGGRMMTVRAVLHEGAVHLHGPFGTRVLVAEPFLAGGGEQAAGSGTLLSPMMGNIIKLNVRVGDTVREDDVLAVQESMKMEFSIRAPWDGVITELACEENQMVERHSHIITMDPLPESGGE